jgi:hypothetical protein
MKKMPFSVKINSKLVIGAFFSVLVVAVLYVVFAKHIFSKEGFKGGEGSGSGSGSWSSDVVDRFIDFEKTVNPLLVFDVKVVQKQATQREVEELLATGMWPWNDIVKKAYKNVLMRDTIRQTDPDDAMNVDQTIYNQTAITELLRLKTPEGKFLLSGVFVDGVNGAGNVGREDIGTGEGTFGIESGLISENRDLIRCGVDGKMKRVGWAGYDGITGLHKKKEVSVDYNDLPSLVPGFSFIKGPCNPCSALKSPANYSCPFSIVREGGEKGAAVVSPIWQFLWGLDGLGVSSGYQEPPIPDDYTAFRINH